MKPESHNLDETSENKGPQVSVKITAKESRPSWVPATVCPDAPSKKVSLTEYAAIQEQIKALLPPDVTFDITSPDFKKAIEQRDFMIADALAMAVAARALSGVDVAYVEVVDPETGYVQTEKVYREMDARGHAITARTFETYQNQKRKAAGMATEIHEIQMVDVTDERSRIAESKVQALRERLLAPSPAPLALESGDVVDGEVIENEREKIYG